MVSDDFAGYRFKCPVGTGSTANSAGFKLSANSLNPFVFAYRLIPGFSGFFAFKTFGIQILPAAKKGTEQGYFFFRGGEIINSMISAVLNNCSELGRMGFGFGRLIFQALKFGPFADKQLFKFRDFTFKFPG
ncbi:MAG: hypothetical protein LBK27_00025 [Treponema sp.]|nr:hypothetical protein [Treponema sp.]